MGARVEVREEVTNAVVGAMAKHGFALKSGVMTAPLTDNFSGFLGLPFAMFRGDGLVGLSPVIGVICRPLADFVSRLSEGLHGRIVPSLATSLGYLMPERTYLEWLFDPQGDAAIRCAEAKRIVLAIEEFGLPFMRENCSMKALMECLELNKYSFVERTEYHLPVAYALFGEIDKARDYVRFRVDEMSNRADESASAYRRFAENLHHQERWPSVP